MNDFKTLKRKTSNAMLGGVCSGLGDYFVIDPIIFRLIFAVLFFSFGVGGLLYFILWIVLPEDRSYGHYFNSKKAQYSSETKEDTTDNNFNTSGSMNDKDDFEKKEPNYSPKRRGNLTGGLILIIVGVLFLISNLVPHISFGEIIRTWWPLILIVVGISSIFSHYRGKDFF